MTRTYLIKRNGKYHFRIRVPKDLRSSIGTGEIHRSLGTSGSRLAKTLAGNLRAKVESEFAQLRHQQMLNLQHILPIPKDEDLPPTLSPTTERYQKPSLALSQLIEEFGQDREKSWAPKSKHMHLESYRILIGFGGCAPD